MKISIIVPVYNIEQYIGRCLESLVKQTYKNIEIIVVNDESCDSSLEICENYANFDARIQIINKTNGGLSSARNEGIKYATGDYVLFVDGDDSISLETCEELSKIVKNKDIDLVIFKYIKILDNKQIRSLDSGNTEFISNKEAYRRYLYGENIVPATWTKLYKRELFDNILFPIGILAEDFATTHKFILKANKVVYYDKSFYNYFIRENSIMATKSLKLTLDYYKTADEKYQSELKLFPEYRTQVESLYTNCLLRTFARLYIEDQDNAVLDEVVLKLESINFKNLTIKTKLAYCLYRTNLNLFIFFMKKFNKTI